MEEKANKTNEPLVRSSDEYVMLALKEAANKLGLTPEMLFRAADKN